MKIATAKRKTSKNWVTEEVSWDSLLNRLRNTYKTSETLREYKAMSKEDKDRAKGAKGGFVGGALSCGQRKNGNVVTRSLVTLDADNAYVGQWDKVTALHEFRMCCYSTHSSTLSAPRLRWVIPTDRDMTPDEYPAVARRVAEWFGMQTFDKTTFEAARLMYFPTTPADQTYEWHEQDGELLCVDEVLQTYGLNPDAWRDMSKWPLCPDEMELRSGKVKSAQDPTEKPGIVGLFCRAYDIPTAIDTFLSDVYTEAGAGRYTYVNGSSVAGAIVYNDGQFLYSNHATDPAGGMSCNAFDLVRIHKFGDKDDTNECEMDIPITKRPSYKAMCEWASGLDEVKEQEAAEASERARKAFGDLVGQSEDELYSDGEDWKKKLELDPKTGAMLPTLNNAILYIRNHEHFRGVFGYNPMADQITVSRSLPWQEKRKQGHKNALDSVIGGSKSEKEGIWDIDAEEGDFLAYFERLGYPARGGYTRMLENALKVVAQENTYHPIKDYLEGLEWDGKPRMETVFIRWLGAEDNELNREITKLWLIGAVDRIIRPGHQFDQILITCGKQGIGKSKMLRLLSKGHFTNSVSKLSTEKSTAEILQDVWIVELGELDSVKRGDQATVKDFITSIHDRYRAAYKHQAETHPRQCVFAGTSNEGSFLRDNTGERRYWVMPVDGIGDDGELRGFENEVDQIWAETVELWKQRMIECAEPGQTQDDVNLFLYLRDKKFKEEMLVRQSGYKLPEDDREDIENYLEMPRPDNWESMSPYDRRAFINHDWVGDYDKCTKKIDKVCIKEIRFEVFGDKPEKNLRIGSILDTMPGWKKSTVKRRFRTYADSPRLAWVRVGSEEDTGK